MKLKQAKQDWESIAQRDPLYAILSDATKRNKKWEEEEFFLTGEQEIAEVIAGLKKKKLLKKFGTALDFGCGVGRLTQPLAKRFEKVYGVDISSMMIHLAKKENKYSKTCKYVLNQQVSLERFKDNTFDFIYSSITLQHIKPAYAKKYVAEFIRVLKPEGILCFQLPTKRRSVVKHIAFRITPFFVLRILMKLLRKNPTRMHGQSKKKVVEFIESEGGVVIETESNWKGGSYGHSLNYYITK